MSFLTFPEVATPGEAREIQERLRGQVILEDRLSEIRRVAGIDVGFIDDGATARAAVVVLEFPSLRLLEAATALSPTRFPYVPGLLSFREIPVVLKALEKLKDLPDLLVCDGQGVAHPRRLGIASHLGLWTEIPAIGAAKSRLIGEHGPIPAEKGGWTPLLDRGERVGAVLRTRKNVKPLYISIGHKVSLETAIALVMALVTRYRLPETSRLAHHLASDRSSFSP